MGRRPGGKHDEQIAAMCGAGATVPQIMREVGYSNGGVKSVLNRLGLAATPAKRGRNAHGQPDSVAVVRKAAAVAAARRVRDRRRFKHAPVPMGTLGNVLLKHSVEAVRGKTKFPARVLDPVDGENILIDGSSNSKIGGDVLVGELTGARIFTLTLEERATCPRSCSHWLSCYGNSMQWSRRWRAGPALEARIRQDVGDLCRLHDRVLIRLHVLGDFYSREYVQMWGLLIERFINLHIFGFTAWPRDSNIGQAIVSASHLRRFNIRHSGTCGAMGSFTIDFPTARKRIGDAIVCPEQLDAMNGSPRGVHCGNCGVCWSTDRAIVFIEH